LHSFLCDHVANRLQLLQQVVSPALAMPMHDLDRILELRLQLVALDRGRVVLQGEGWVRSG